LDKEDFYFGKVNEDTMFNYEAYADGAHSKPLRDKSITIMG
jgi:hypothetical protein